ncbi:hypothetical protein [Fredinandcohnia sp. 179-A 10B2 NHS]|uniref:hypothetical protein n=1 Tax=Fredinandcohnia sp. 179-A 10B2 NHS TaxID=3235176 RepID=UPI0039A07A86
MKGTESSNFVYQTSVGPSTEEFLLELYTYSPDFSTSLTPYRTISSFDELISVLEFLDDNEDYVSAL